MARRRPSGSYRPIRPGHRSSITLLPEGVNLDVTKPNPQARRRNLVIGKTTIKPSEKLVTYVARDLEPYRGFHLMMRAVPHLLRARKDIRVVMVGGDGISYGVSPPNGTWREKMLAELGDAIDPSRVLFPGRIDYETYVAMLQRSDAHVYLTYPFVASWSMREALGAGCVVIGSDTPPVTRIHHARAEWPAGVVLRSEGARRYGAARAGGCAAREAAAGECPEVCREEPVDGGLYGAVRGADR